MAEGGIRGENENDRQLQLTAHPFIRLSDARTMTADTITTNRKRETNQFPFYSALHLPFFPFPSFSSSLFLSSLFLFFPSFFLLHSSSPQVALLHRYPPLLTHTALTTRLSSNKQQLHQYQQLQLRTRHTLTYLSHYSTLLLHQHTYTYTRMTQAEVDYDYEALPENASLTACLLAGAFAGVAEHAVMYPVDSIKVNIRLLTFSFFLSFLYTCFVLSFLIAISWGRNKTRHAAITTASTTDHIASQSVGLPHQLEAYLLFRTYQPLRVI